MKKHIIIITSFVISLIGAIHSHGADEPVRKPLEPSNPNQRNLSYCVEVFSMTLKEAAKNRRSKPSDKQLYSTLVKGLESKKVEQLNYITFKGLSGTTISSEAITEQIYPTEFSSSEELKNTTNEATPEKANSLTPTKFETRNIGAIFECESNLSLTKKTIDLFFGFECVGHTGQYKYGKGDKEQQYPKFETRRASTTVITSVDSPKLLFTLDYSPFFEADKEFKDKVYFLFVTVDVEESTNSLGTEEPN